MTYETQGLSKTERRLAALELALSLYDYDRETGTITRVRDGAVMDHVAPCGSILLSTKIRTISAQQFVWYLMDRTDPNADGTQVVHINNEPDNNHWSNLERRLGSVINRAPNRNNTTSPYSGVSLNRKTGYYRASYRDALDNNRVKIIGQMFNTAHEAKVARDEVVGQMMAVLIANGFRNKVTPDA